MQDPGMPSQQDISSKKIAAGVCAILLGWLGVHKFILDMTTPGIIMLAVGLGGIALCGFPTAVMCIIGIIEGIIYLTKSDQEFYEEYMVKKKPWF